MIVYRPTEDRSIVQVRYVDQQRTGVVVAVRVFSAAGGELLREERP
jgi:hypothetical protein